jgi:hypothetical protein
MLILLNSSEEIGPFSVLYPNLRFEEPVDSCPTFYRYERQVHRNRQEWSTYVSAGSRSGDAAQSIR